MKTALIVGCSDSVWDDVTEAQNLTRFDAVYCVKLAGVHWPHQFQTWITLHPEWMQKYADERASLGRPGGYEWVAPLKGEVGRHAQHEPNRRVSYRWPGMNASASSGIYGAKVALDDGFERVVLAGIPMQAGGKHFTRGKEWTQCDAFLVGLKNSIPFLKDKVRSVSGLTKELLGAPTPGWLAGDPQ